MDISKMTHVETQFGKIDLKDLPILDAEPLTSKFSKSMIFFSFIIVILFIVIFIIPWKKNIKTKVNLGSERKIGNGMNANTLTVEDNSQIENVILITSDKNMISIGNNKLNNFKNSLNISQIIIVKNPEKPCNKFINVTLYDGKERIWNYSGPLVQDRIETTLYVTKTEWMSPEIEIEEYVNPDTRTIMNENAFAIQLSETGDDYKSY